MANIRAKKYLIRKTADYIGALLIVLLVLLIWRLYYSPIPLPFLKPYIIKALSHDDSTNIVTLDRVDLELVRSLQPIKIIAKDVVYQKSDNSIIIQSPRTSIAFSMKALIRGIISPSSILVESPAVTLFTNYGINKDVETEHIITEKKAGYYFEAVETFIERFNAEDLMYPESYINEIVISNASFELHEVELGRKWNFSDANYIFTRHDKDMKLELNALMELDDIAFPLDFTMLYYPENSQMDVKFGFADLVPANIVDNIVGVENMNNFYRINMPVSGVVSVEIDFDEISANKEKISQSLDNAIKNFDFKFEGGGGTIAFSDDENFNYDVSSFILEGEIASKLDAVNIDDAKFNLGDKNIVLNLDITGLKKLILNGAIDDLEIVLEAKINELEFAELSDYWPRYIAEDAWEWCKESLYAGSVQDGEFKFSFGYDKKEQTIAFKDLSGKGSIVDASLNYLEGMPDVKHIYGTGYFYNDRIDIKIDKGVSLGTVVTGGHVLLYDLNKYDNFIDIKLIADSTITESLELIDNPPFNFAKDLGINPSDIVGRGETTLQLKFELKNDLEPEEVHVSVDADLYDVVIKNMIADAEITSSRLYLHVDNDALLAKGKVEVLSVPMDMEWKRDFNTDKSIYNISFIFNDTVKDKFGIDSDIFKHPNWYGEAEVIGVIEENNANMIAKFNADLKNTVVEYDFLGFVKNKGERGKASFVIDMTNGKVNIIRDIELIKDDFGMNAEVRLNDKGEISIIDILNIRGPRTDAKARIDIGNANQAIKVNISGNSYDLSKIFESDEKSTESKDIDINVIDSDKMKSSKDTDIYIAVDRLWTNETVPVTQFAGSASIRNGIGLHEIKMVGNYANDKKSNFKFDYVPRATGDYIINISSTDAGKTLKVLHLYENMQGGELDISARRDINKMIVGHAKIRDFSIQNTNFLTTLVNLSSLTGILDTIRGDGIVFTHFDAPFSYKDGKLELEELSAFGNVLGISSDGYIDLKNDKMDIKGMIAPAYTINRFLGNIPLVGNMLSGKENTAFAANYSAKGKLDDPNVKVNPLSIISPNSLKGLFIRGGNDKKN